MDTRHISYIYLLFDNCQLLCLQLYRSMIRSICLRYRIPGNGAYNEAGQTLDANKGVASRDALGTDRGKEYSEISITELTERAGIARQTLYRNYTGMNDILLSRMDEILVNTWHWSVRTWR